MSAKIIIWCPGRPNVNGARRRTFQWNATYNCYVHENRELTEQEYMACCDKVFKQNHDLRPQVRIVQFSDGASATPREITLDEALAVVQRLSPEKLRKTNYGRKPNVPEPEAMAVG